MTNPKGRRDPRAPLAECTALSGPLLSRFDLLLVLRDAQNPDWDAAVSSHILTGHEAAAAAAQKRPAHTQVASQAYHILPIRTARETYPQYRHAKFPCGRRRSLHTGHQRRRTLGAEQVVSMLHNTAAGGRGRLPQCEAFIHT